ncbi:PTS IIA-like nitrogen regulatory protein PtsN [Exilibacterium tricleocarpae]|uniref:PTS IIA-like nitrogen regulatory protein PtsN n=1 Tax=Exilibacterium tricleocarpae TaxID=2591008 RepID=A0A545TSH9_9GAMM|nr:PTS IIA-like nitrogen regulatory protein PtsN [Exilibacterium tricleocarpae]TQV80172.1 PTS IIA-like nitrogen regulatory protein PtsN [Exilibacterium tricleocarpae]
MQIESILAPRRTQCRVAGISKKRVLEALAGLMSRDLPMLGTRDLFGHLIARERLGSTGIGKGIAIPHCRIENCTGTVGGLITLAKPVDYDAIDNEPVDIVFVLLVPEEAQEAHLQTLAALAERLSNRDYCNRLRRAETDQALYQAALEAW